MMKTAMFVSALALTMPALAQDIPGKPMISQDTPATQQTTPPVQTPSETTPTADPAVTAQDAMPTPDAAAQTQQIPAAPTEPAQPAQAAEVPQATAPADGAATGKEQIAQIVAAEFPSYDKNSDGNLDKAEFADWMVALKKASDPATKAEDPATQQWVGGAFASADTDKSNAVSQQELTDYLSQSAG